jgi:hypothetical protein
MKPFSLSVLITVFIMSVAHAQQTSGSDRQRIREENFSRRHPRVAERMRRHREENGSGLYRAAQQEKAVEKRERHKVTLKNKQEARMGCGTVSLSTIVPLFRSFYRTDGRYVDVPAPLAIPAISYKYFIGNRLAIGFSIANEYNNGNAFVHRNYDIAGHYKGRILTIAPECTFAYAAHKKKFFYLSLAAGYSIVNKRYDYKEVNYLVANQYGITLPTSAHNEYLNMHLGAGIRFGSTLGGFIEFGMGFKGLLNCGLSAKL